MKSLPMLCLAWGESVDVVRGFLRKNPELVALGRTFGPIRLYDQQAAEQIRLAFEARKRSKRAAGEATAAK